MSLYFSLPENGTNLCEHGLAMMRDHQSLIAVQSYCCLVE